MNDWRALLPAALLFVGCATVDDTRPRVSGQAGRLSSTPDSDLSEYRQHARELGDLSHLRDLNALDKRAPFTPAGCCRSAASCCS